MYYALFFSGTDGGLDDRKRILLYGGLYAGNHRGVRGPSGGVMYV